MYIPRRRQSPQSLYTLSAFVIVDQLNSANHIQTLPLPNTIKHDLIRKYSLKGARHLFTLLKNEYFIFEKSFPIIYEED